MIIHAVLPLLLLGILPALARVDFVEKVDCEADGMLITLKSELPTPQLGMWDLEVQNFPDCLPVTKTDVGGGFQFRILYNQTEICGVNAEYIMTPKYMAVARVVLVLKDDAGRLLVDSVECTYGTRIKKTMKPFKEERSQNLMMGGMIDEEVGADVENQVEGEEGVEIDFLDKGGKPLRHRQVELGEIVVLMIDVTQSKTVRSLVPDTCFFSSSPQENGGQKLTFIKNKCFNYRNTMVREVFQTMERNLNGTEFRMKFPAFHFTDQGTALFVHCTILACVGHNNICQPKPDCFSSSRRKRELDTSEMEASEGREVVAKFTRFIELAPERRAASSGGLETELIPGSLCLEWTKFLGIVGSLSAAVLVLLIVVSCLVGRIARARKHRAKGLDRFIPAYSLPPSSYYAQSLQNLPSVTTF